MANIRIQKHRTLSTRGNDQKYFYTSLPVPWVEEKGLNVKDNLYLYEDIQTKKLIISSSEDRDSKKCKFLKSYRIEKYGSKGYSVTIPNEWVQSIKGKANDGLFSTVDKETEDLILERG